MNDSEPKMAQIEVYSTQREKIVEKDIKYYFKNVKECEKRKNLPLGFFDKISGFSYEDGDGDKISEISLKYDTFSS